MKTSFPPLLAAMALLFAFCDQVATPPSVAAPKQENHSAKAIALRKQVDIFTAEGKYDSALACARMGVEISAKENDWQEWGRAEMNVLYSLYFLERSAEADSLFAGIDSIAKEKIHPDSIFWGNFLNCAMVISDELGDYDKAFSYGNREIEFYKKKGDLNSLAVASNNIGTSYRSRGDYDRALDYTEDALEIYLSRPDTNAANLAWTYGNLSKIWYRKKDFSKAIENAQKALDILEQHFHGQKPDEFIIIYNDLANAYIEKQQPDTALNYLRQALHLFEKHNLADKAKIEFTWHNMGNALRESGKYDEAAIYLHRAIERYGSKHPLLGKAYRHLGDIAFKKKDFRAALEWQQKALSALTNDSFFLHNPLANPTAQSVDSYSDFLLTLRDKGETLRQLAEKESNPQFLEGALSAFDLAVAVLDSMRTEYQEGSRKFWNEEARPIMENAVETAFQLYEKSGREQRYLEQALRYAEKSKAQLLAEALRESAAKEQVKIPRELLRQEKELKIDMAFYESQIFSEQQKKDPDAGKIERWKNQAREYRHRYEALLDTFKNSYRTYFEIKYKDYTPTLASLQQQLSTNTGLLEYFRGEHKIYAFYVDKTTVRGFYVELDSVTPSLERLLAGLRNRVEVYEKGRSAEAVRQFARDAASVFQAIVAPAGKMPEKLLIIPDGDLAYLPFELLLTEKSMDDTLYAKLPYLLRQTTIRYEYSAGVAFQPSPNLKPQKYFAGYAPSYTNDWPSNTSRGDNTKCRRAEAADFGPLGNNEEEVRKIAKLLWGQAFTGEEATEKNFKENAEKPRILHLAMHGFLNDCDPLYSGLVFSLKSLNASQDSAVNEGFLCAYEIYNLKLNAELVVLSACNTGLGQMVKGEGAMSLARAFKYAGCPNVVMSLWQAEDRATAQVMERFYGHLKDGMSKDEALCRAKLEYLDGNNHNHPFFWGAFVLIGDDAPVTHSSPWVLYIAASLLALSLLAAGFYFWKRKNKFKTR